MRNLILLSLCSVLAFADAEYSFPDPAAQCVAWKTRKRMFLLSTVRPVGINCSITVRSKVTPDGSQLEVSIPIAGFSSGEPERDREVEKLLKREQQSDLLVRTTPARNSPFDSLRGEIPAEIKIGGVSFPITVPYEIVTREGVPVLIGAIKTTYSAFGISPPTVGGGAIAKVHDELELHYQLRKDLLK